MPEYTISLAIWIVPICVLSVFFIRKRLLTPEKLFALLITVMVCGAVGAILDLLFALTFFKFPDASMTIGWKVTGDRFREERPKMCLS